MTPPGPRGTASSLVVVDGANVVGSRPDGWWKDRAGAARRLHEQLMLAPLEYDDVVLVLEGAAKGGVPSGRDGHVVTVHAQGHGDDAILREATRAVERGLRVAVVTADRELQARVGRVGAVAVGPTWLLGRL